MIHNINFSKGLGKIAVILEFVHLPCQKKWLLHVPWQDEDMGYMLFQC